jgi:hypothetical protein
VSADGLVVFLVGDSWLCFMLLFLLFKPVIGSPTALVQGLQVSLQLHASATAMTRMLAYACTVPDLLIYMYAVPATLATASSERQLHTCKSTSALIADLQHGVPEEGVHTLLYLWADHGV